jgi:hypothetical protein
MEAEKVLAALLLASTALAGLVDDNIDPGESEQATPLPYLVTNHISTVLALPSVTEDGSSIVTSRLQVTAFADTYPQLASLLDLVRLACVNRRGTIAGVTVHNVRLDSVGPDAVSDEGENAGRIFMRSIDFLVTVTQANQ